MDPGRDWSEDRAAVAALLHTHDWTMNMTPPTDVPAPHPLIRIEALKKDYAMGTNIVQALRGVDLSVQRGELVAVMGPSGSGKSTFLHILGCLDRPSSGQYFLDGLAVRDLTIRQLAILRNRKLGFIFQTFHLPPRANALENVMLPLLYAGITGKPAEERSRQALAAVGLADRASHRPNQLSGGQQQRVAIARSLVMGPALLLADEPTGNLDTRTSLEVMAILQELHAAGITILIVTHEPDVAAFCERVVSSQDSKVVEDRATPNPRLAADVLAELAPGGAA